MKILGGLSVLVLGSFALYCAAVAQGPDYSISFERELPSKASPEELGRLLSDLKTWPQWFHSTQAVTLENPPGTQLDGSAIGRHLKLTVVPKRSRESIEIVTRVKNYIPGREIELVVQEDSSRKLQNLFQDLTWKVEVIPQDRGAIVRGTETLRTRNWRSRVFGKISRRIMMHQLFYPNLLKLAESGTTPLSGKGRESGRPGVFDPTPPKEKPVFQLIVEAVKHGLSGSSANR